MASSSRSTKVCFNSTCKEVLEIPKQGWLCRTGDFADLCDRCASAFKDGKFCDTYHLNASGWRSCETCGKQVHCGCIVSFHMFILLDAGGIECLNCAKAEYILTPNPTWPSASHFLPGPAERIRDISSKNWRSIAGSDPVPWRQSPSLMNASNVLPLAREQLTSCFLGKTTTDGPSERLTNENWRISESEMIGGRARTTGVRYDGQRNVFRDASYQSCFHVTELATPLSSFPATFMAQDQNGEKGKVSGIHFQGLCPTVGKQCPNNSGTGPSLEAQAHNSKARGEIPGRHQPLPCYWPPITDQELQQISGGSNAKITPLFEKVLSASDAGRIGRLVLPKKCAEAYLPPISQPEGYPLVVQDLKGKDWVLQFRYWPNNNSRMYVLEGVTPCIQSMQLQAGDTVTFSKLEPEGKLIMGFRRTSLVSPSCQGNEEPLKGSPWSEADKISIRDKRKKGGKTGSNSKHVKLNNGEMLKLKVTLEQLQGLLQPSLTNTPTVVLIDGVEFEDFQESPVIGKPPFSLTNRNGSLCSPEIEPTPEHVEHILPMIDHVSSKENKSENAISVKTMDGLNEFADLATKHKSTCTCNVCLAVKCSIIHNDEKHLEKEVGNSVQNQTPLPHSENDANRVNASTSSFRNQNIDLNIQPKRDEEEFSPV